MTTFAPEELLESQIDKWILVRVLGHGGMAVVYEAKHEFLSHRSAVKLLQPGLPFDTISMERFQQEALLLSKLKHPNVVEIRDFGEDPDHSYYMVMELLEGSRLDNWMEQAPLPLDWVSAVMEQLCSALEAIHELQIIHRDLKPSNVIVCPNEPYPLVKLVDFGIAKAANDDFVDRLTQTGAVVGTPHYLAPEQIRSGQSIRTQADLYSLGVIAYEMLTGTLPLEGEGSFEHMMLVVQEVPRPLGEHIPEYADSSLEKLIAKLLAKQPTHRPLTASQVWKAWSNAVQELRGTSSATPSSKPAKAKRLPSGVQHPVPVEISETSSEPNTLELIELSGTQRTFSWGMWVVLVVGLFGLGAWLVSALYSPSTSPNNSNPTQKRHTKERPFNNVNKANVTLPEKTGPKSTNPANRLKARLSELHGKKLDNLARWLPIPSLEKALLSQASYLQWVRWLESTMRTSNISQVSALWKHHLQLIRLSSASTKSAWQKGATPNLSITWNVEKQSQQFKLWEKLSSLHHQVKEELQKRGLPAFLRYTSLLLNQWTRTYNDPWSLSKHKVIVELSVWVGKGQTVLSLWKQSVRFSKRGYFAKSNNLRKRVLQMSRGLAFQQWFQPRMRRQELFERHVRQLLRKAKVAYQRSKWMLALKQYRVLVKLAPQRWDRLKIKKRMKACRCAVTLFPWESCDKSDYPAHFKKR